MMRCVALLCGILFAAPALADPVAVDVTGTGSTREDAIAQGLVEAIQQVTGVAVSADQVRQSTLAAAAVTTKDGDTSSVAIAETAQGSIRRTANGIVRSYRIIDTEADEPMHVVLHLSVSVETFAPKGVGSERRRIAVAAFAGAAGQADLRETLRDRTISYLTQARRFAVLDRANDQIYAHEMATLQSQAPPAERAREGQVIGADYVLTGTIRQAGVARSDRTIALTGERIVAASSSLALDWQVLDIATRQVKWTGTVALGAGGDGLGALLDRAAARIGDDITQAIYPMRLIDFTDPAAMIINQGGATLHAGQRFRAMLLGKELFDPYTKESLGQTEREVAIVEVQRVDTKISYARLVSGQLPQADADLVLRPSTAAPQARTQRPAAPTSPPVVKLPGDR